MQINKLKTEIKALLKDLTTLYGAPGAEHDVALYISRAAKEAADEVVVDSMGNVIALKKGHDDKPSVMLAAHMDEIACIVKAIEKDGFIRFDKTGDISDTMLPGRRVKIANHFGTIGIRPKHLDLGPSGDKAKPAAQLYVDIGASSEVEVRSCGIRIGTPIYFEGEFREMVNPDIICSKSIDDRLGCAVLLQLLRSSAGKDFGGNVHFVFTVQEEIGFRGAQISANRLKPDLAFVIDTIPSGDTPDVSYSTELPVRLGGGPVLVVAEAEEFYGHIMCHRIIDRVVELAERKKIPYQMAALMGGYVTDASTIHLSNTGIPTGVLALPRRYSHSPVEMTHLDDSANALRLLMACLEESETIAQSAGSFLG